MRFKTGATREGKLIASRQISTSTLALTMIRSFRSMPLFLRRGPTRFQTSGSGASQVATNVQKSGSYRGLGGIKVCFAQEQQLDMLAEKLGLDPWELRYKNALRVGSTIATATSFKKASAYPIASKRLPLTTARRSPRPSARTPRAARARPGAGEPGLLWAGEPTGANPPT